MNGHERHVRGKIARRSVGFASCAAGLWCLLAAAPIDAQIPVDELQAMREEMARLRSEVNALKEEVRELKGAGAATPSVASSSAAPAQESSTPPATATTPAPVAEEQPTAAEVLPLLQAQVAEQAQTKVESNSKFPVKLFGMLVSNTFFNSGEAAWLENPILVPPAPTNGLPSGSFTSTLRQSRLGATWDGPTIGPFRTSGLFSVDFYGGVPNFRTGQVMGLPRLLYAYVRLESAHSAIEIGQDQMILAPRNPTSLAALSFPDLYAFGNLYLRAPQIRGEHTFATGERGELLAVGGILAPIGGDFTASSYSFAPPALAGERSRRPALQGRLAWRARPKSSGRAFELGFSGHYGNERYANAEVSSWVAAQAGYPANDIYVNGSISSWAAALDLDAQAGRFGLGGEWYVGKNIDAFGGSLGQLAKSAGGFVEGRWRATSRLDFNTGVGRDRLYDLRLFPALLLGNTAVYANTIFRWTPEFASSLEYRWLSTAPGQGSARHNNHLNLVFVYSF